MTNLFNNIFICYSRQDEIQAINIFHRLNNEKFDIFLDQRNIDPGIQWESQTLSKLHNANFIVIVLTEGSKERNGYAMKEIKRALKLYDHDLEARRMIFPVKIGDAELPEGLSRFQWTPYSVEGLDKMVESFKKQQKKWKDEISLPQTSFSQIVSLRESWPLLTLIITLITLLSISMTMSK